MNLDPDATAVVIVDMQNGFCHPDGTLYAPGSEAAVEPCAQLVAQAREAEASVVFTQDVHPPEQFADAHYYDEFEQWGEHVLEDSWDAELVDELSPTAEDLVVEKHTYDAFFQTQLDGWLTAHGIDDLLFGGTLANVCVLHTSGSAGLRDYRPIMVEDAIGAIEGDHKSYALDHADWLYGELASLDDVAFA